MNAPIGDEVARVDLRHDEGVVTARQRARDVAELLGFDRLEQTRIATAVSELARNAHRYAGGGEVRISCGANAMRVEVVDAGPGIPNLEEVLRGDYTSATGLGRGLVGVRQLMDEFEIEAARGTRVRVAKRLPGPAPDAREVRAELARRGAVNPFDEVSRQNEELLQALGEVRARQKAMLALNRELEETNTGVVALYAELDERAQRLRDADERKSRFLADMSHELRTPLNSIIALAELLLSGKPPLASEQATQVSFIRRVAQDQLTLVGDLLDIAKIEAGRLELELEDVALSELLVLLRGQLRPLLKDAGVQLRFDFPPAEATLRTDEAKLIQVLRNLISNAVKFTPQGEVLVSAEVLGPRVRFTVADTGIGIAADDLPRIFEEFVQIPGERQKARQGTGLGLPLAKTLVGLLGGEMTVRSTVGVGTAFTIELPLRHDVDSSVPDVTGAVLVVDDDETSRYVVEAHLRDTAWRTVAVAGGEPALAALAEALPAAVILDLSMPDLDGVEVLRRMRADARMAAVPVIIHTSRLLERWEVERLEGLGAHVLDKSRTSRSQLLEVLSVATR
ncbi:ATP-binding protein [Solirubrobacter sp. CPCC 204708]|uniref:histidine kinase n=1 Tax=Solirubrobacter deserti TaxID=2282478 RepID=A0ABT4RCF2_9ACTN|nr:ATP-binding protein [Solirubrobacter deserti]MBE2315568.1 ATP-binding protein [Solirubrobacter deserti]MDA0136207.1 ATP-binding protein [Solirubrobacter deserti]